LSDYYVLPVDTQGYEAGAQLRDVTLREARAMECNRCGDCCNSLNENVKRDEVTGLPMVVWGSKFPEDLYESRYGKRMLQPVGFLDDSSEMPYQGRIGIVDKFEEDENGKPYTCFSCAFHRQDTPEFSTCTLMETYSNPDPKKIEQLRPLNCGDFPIFGTSINDTLVAGHPFVPATGSLPRCTWHGLRIVGPYRDELYWIERWEKQQRGEEVETFKVDETFIKGLEWKAAQRRLKGQNNDGAKTVD